MKQNSLESTETVRLLNAVAAGDRAAANQLLDRHRPELLRYAGLGLDTQLRARIDPSDVVQETQLEAAKRLDDYLLRRPMPFPVWLRRTDYERLLMIRRRELGAQQRSMHRELPLPEQSSLALAANLSAPGPSPSRALSKQETAKKVREAIARLASRDRKVLLMRTFETASYEEIGFVLGISPEAAKKRHGRALLGPHQLLLESGLGGSGL